MSYQISLRCALRRCALRRLFGDFPGGPAVKNPPSSAGDAGSIPGWGTKTPHAAGQLSPRAATTEPTHSGAHAPQLERSPHAAMKSLRAATKTQCSQINK